jgi:non-heme chloroperoxidase
MQPRLLRAELPYGHQELSIIHMPKLKVGTEANHPIELHFEDYGSGKPVVLIHGWPLSGRSWEAQVSALVAAGYRVITYDRRGFGASSQPWSGYDYDTFAADLHGLITHLELKDATLVGFSMGGGEVARYIGTYGTERVTKAVFAGAVPPYLYKSADNPEGGLDDATIKQFEGGVTGDRIAFLDGFTTGFFSAAGKLIVSEAQRAYALSIASLASPKGTLDCINAFSRTDFRADLAKFKIPTLVIHGDSDAIVPIEVSGARTHKAIEGSVLHVIKGAPHGFNVSHAAEFNKKLLEFLSR